MLGGVVVPNAHQKHTWNLARRVTTSFVKEEERVGGTAAEAAVNEIRGGSSHVGTERMVLFDKDRPIIQHQTRGVCVLKTIAKTAKTHGQDAGNTHQKSQ